MAEKLKKFEDGSSRSEQKARYDLMSPDALQLLGEHLALGAGIHGERNWEKGGPAFKAATISHLLEHILSYMREPNIADASAIITNAHFIAHFEAQRNKFCQAVLKREDGLFTLHCGLKNGHAEAHIERDPKPGFAPYYWRDDDASA